MYPFIWFQFFFLSINNFVSYTAEKSCAIYHEHAVLFFHFDRKWLEIFLSKVSRQKHATDISRTIPTFVGTRIGTSSFGTFVHSSFEKWIFFLSSFLHLFCRKRSRKISIGAEANRSISKMLKFDKFFFFSKKRTIQKIHWDFHLVKRKYPKNRLSFNCKIISVLSKKIFWKLYSSLNEFEYLFVAWKKRRAAFGKLSSFLYSMLVRWHSNYALGPTRLPEPTPLRRTFSRSFHVFKRGFCNVILIVKGSQVTRVF